MEPLRIVALAMFILLLSLAGALELRGTWRFTIFTRNLVKRAPNTPGS